MYNRHGYINEFRFLQKQYLNIWIIRNLKTATAVIRDRYLSFKNQFTIRKIILKILAPISKKYPWTPFPFISKGLYFSGSLSFILWKIESTSIASSNSIRSRSTFLPFLDQAGLLNSVGSSQS